MKERDGENQKPKKIPGFGFRLPAPLIPAFRKAFAAFVVIVKKKHGFDLDFTKLMVACIESFVCCMNEGTPPVWPPRWQVCPKEEPPPPELPTSKRRRPKK